MAAIVLAAIARLVIGHPRRVLLAALALLALAVVFGAPASRSGWTVDPDL